MEPGRWYSTVKIELGGQKRIYTRISSSRGAASYLLDQWQALAINRTKRP